MLHILCQQATNREGDLKAKTGWKAWEDPAPVSAIPIPTVTQVCRLESESLEQRRKFREARCLE